MIDEEEDRSEGCAQLVADSGREVFTLHRLLLLLLIVALEDLDAQLLRHIRHEDHHRGSPLVELPLRVDAQKGEVLKDGELSTER